MTRLDEIRDRLENASPGPWRLEWRGQDLRVQAPDEPDPITEFAYGIATWEPQVHEQRAECDTGNAELIANAPGDIAWLISEVEHLRTLCTTYGERLGRLSELVLEVAAFIGPPDDHLNPHAYEMILRVQAMAGEIMSDPSWTEPTP